MDYTQVAQILNTHVFAGDRAALLRKVAQYPERYLGLFRPTTPRAKLVQNLLQSHEIRFGDALEQLLRRLLQEMGYHVFPPSEHRLVEENLALDQFFRDARANHYYFIEQKVRDDHDSTKKRGQMANFEAKLEVLYQRYGPRLTGILYFIDPALQKNREYYRAELQRMAAFYQGAQLHLFYGPDLFHFLGHAEVWDALLSWLARWRQEIPDFPEVNMDLHPVASFQELKAVPLRLWRKFLTHDELWQKGIAQVLFPQGTTLRYLARYFQAQERPPYRQLAALILQRLEQYDDDASPAP